MNRDKIRILLVDDDSGDRKNMKRMLSRASIDCVMVEADSVSKAFDIDQEDTFDCIFLDFQMPEMDGLTALRAFLNRWPAAAVIMSTGQGDEKIASEAIKAGAVDYVAKRDMTETSIGKIITNSLSIMAMRREMVEQRRDLEYFAHVLVHDLAAPIASVRLLALFIAENVSDNRFDLVSKDVSSIGQSADRMSALIKSVSSHLLMGIDLVPVMLSTTSIVQGAVDDLKVAIESSGAEVVFDNLPEIYGDAALLTQLFQNLISNAIKFCKNQTPRIVIDVKSGADGKWLISVEDNGIGIADESRQRIFEPFSRLNSINAYAGSGLGLATCQRIISRHGGEVWCESTLGEGTAFFFTLPMPVFKTDGQIAA